LVGDFDSHLDTLEPDTLDLVFFDGNHNKEATLRYFEKLLPKAHNNSLFIFDDIYWSKDMTEAWELIKNHPKVTVTVDTFFWGFVFFRKEQVKEDFVVRV
jgi:predicted O-methyltransferase YrrM